MWRFPTRTSVVVACGVRTGAVSFHKRFRLSVPMLMTSRRTEAMAKGYVTQVKRQSISKLASLLLIGMIASIAGCASGKSESRWTGPSKAAAVQANPWEYGKASGRVLETPHYLVHTTITDEDVLRRLPQVLEGAYAQYQTFAPGTGATRPMKCYVFNKRGEWADFTSKHTGADAAIYLQITRGGYTIGDWFVSYYVGETSTYSVASHEGWHQYVSRNFKGR